MTRVTRGTRGTRGTGFDKLRYDPYTGAFTWAVSPGRRVRAGTPAGTESDGYRQVCYGGKVYKAHRLAWFLVYGAWPSEQVDHRNGVRDDNRIANLRAVGFEGNAQNIRVAYKNNVTSGMLGVTRRRKKWEAAIMCRGVKHYLGVFATPEDAHAAYVEAKRKLHDTCTI